MEDVHSKKALGLSVVEVKKRQPRLRRKPRRKLVENMPRWNKHQLAFLEQGRHDGRICAQRGDKSPARRSGASESRSEEHTSELQSQSNLVCRLLLEKKK